MLKTISLPLSLSLALAIAAPALSLSCASSGTTAKSTERVELNKTKWKLLVAGGRMDGRTVEFIRRAKGAYEGVLIEPGSRLREAVGLDMGKTVLFSLREKAVNEYEGVFKQISPDGSMQEKECLVFINGDELSWNLETATWERVKD